MKIIERIFDATTGETTDVEREETVTEAQARKDAVAAAQERAADELQKATARQAVLTKLGLTAEDAAALLG